ncbi:MAG: hypothetical protein ACO1RX_08025 [Candidatus Sericytochromatia bacterium]
MTRTAPPAVIRWGGGLLLLAGLSAGLGWEMQPNTPGPAAFLQVLASLLLAGAVICLQTQRRTGLSKTLRVGAAGLLLGALGLCLLAGISLGSAHGETLLLSQGLQLPIQVMLLLGGGVYSAGCYHVDATRPWAKRLFLIGLGWGLIGGLWAWQNPHVWHGAQQGMWRWSTLGFVYLGIDISCCWRPDVGRYRPGEGQTG